MSADLPFPSLRWLLRSCAALFVCLACAVGVVAPAPGAPSHSGTTVASVGIPDDPPATVRSDATARTAPRPARWRRPAWAPTRAGLRRALGARWGRVIAQRTAPTAWRGPPVLVI